MNNPDGNALSWLEDISQKLEDLRMEAENQVLFATDSIMSFYSHAMEDLLPPVSDDPMTPEYHPTLCSAHNFYQGMSDNEEMIIRRNHLNSIKNQNNVEIGSEKLDGDSNVASDSNASGSCNSTEELVTQESEEKFHHSETTVVSSPGPVIFDKSGNNSDTSDKIYGAYDEIENNDDNEEGLHVQVSEQQLSNLSRDHESGVLVNEVESLSTQKPAGDDETESTSDDNKEGLDVQVSEQQLDNLSLDDESCVLVNEFESFSTHKPAGDDETQCSSDELDLDDESCVLVSDSEPIPTVDIKGKQISYKKKIKDLLNLKKRFSIKNQIPQDTDSSSQQSSMKIADSSSTKLNNNSMESEWEIL